MKFKSGIVQLPTGQTVGTPADLNPGSPVKAFIEGLGAGRIEKVFKTFQPSDTLSVSRTGELVRLNDLSQIYKITFPENSDIPSIINQLRGFEDIIRANPNRYVNLNSDPNDPLYVVQKSLNQSNDIDIDAPEAWNINTGKTTVIIGVIDTGIDFGHEDLDVPFKIESGYNFINPGSAPQDDRPSSHGTAVSGIAAALTNNQDSGGDFVGVAGIAGGWGGTEIGSPIMPLKIFGPTGSTTWEYIAQAIDFARANGADVINMSFGVLEPNAYDDTAAEAVLNAYLFGVVVVASKGNDESGGRHFPSDFNNNWVLSVGALNTEGKRVKIGDDGTWGSNWGNGIDVMAPGVTQLVYTTKRDELGIGYGSFFGTSAAAPHAAGLAALLLAETNLNPDDVQGIIQATAKDIIDPDDPAGAAGPGYDDKTGYGLIKAGKTLRYVDPDSTLIWRLRDTSGPGSVNHGRYIASSLVTSFIFEGDVNGLLNATRYEIRLDMDFAFEPGEDWQIWGYGEGPGILETEGWMAPGLSETIFTRGFCEIVPGSETENGVTLRTYVYNINGTWYPTYWEWVDFSYGFLSVDFAPAKPQNLTQTASWGYPHLVWDAVEERDLQGYHVYRSTKSNFSPYTKITSSPVSATEYYDDGVRIAGSQKKYYRVKAIDNSSYYSGWSNQVNVNGLFIDKIVSAEIPKEYSLSQNYPNPFNPKTIIRFALPDGGNTTITIFDISGKEVTRLIDGYMPAGYHSVTWNAGNSASGLYLYRISSGDFVKTMKMAVMK